MSVPKSTFDKFVQDWNGRKAWAQSAGIPYNDFASTVKYDYNRMTNSSGYGEKMSDTEAFDAMTSLKNGQNPFQTPADTAPSFFHDPFGAIRNDVQGIVTGLFHLPQQLYHDVDSAVHGHPGSLLPLIPGYTDITSLFSAKGRQYLTEHPISDALDFMGAGKIADLGELALRSAGADGAANVLKAIPDHPASTALKSTFNQAADHIQVLDTLRSNGTKIFGVMGQLKEQREFILRPSRGGTEVIRDFIAPLTPESLSRDVLGKFGVRPKGEAYIPYIKAFEKDMTDEEALMAINMYNGGVVDSRILNDRIPFEPPGPNDYAGFDPTNPGKSAQQFLADPTVSDKSKAYYRALVDMQSNLRTVEWMDYKQIHPVTHLFTGEIGMAKVGGTLDKRNANLERAMAKQATDQGQVQAALQQIRTGVSYVKDPSIQLPPALLAQPGEGAVDLTTALRRSNDYYGAITKSTVFKPDGAMDRLVTHISSLQNIRDAAPLVKDIDSVITALRKLAVPHDLTYTFTMDTLEAARENITRMSHAQSLIGPLTDQLKSSADEQLKLRRSYDVDFNRYGRQEYSYMVQREMRSMITKYVEEHYASVKAGATMERRVRGKMVVITPELLDNAINDIAIRDYQSANVKALFTPGDFKRLQTDAWLMVNDFKMAGHEVYFTTGVSPEEAGTLKRGLPPSLGDTSHFYHRSAGFEREGNPLTNTIYDPRLGIAKETIGLYRQEITNSLIKDFYSNLFYTRDDIIKMAMSFFTGKVEKANLRDSAEFVDRYIKRHGYVKINPTNPFKALTSDDETVYVKSYNARLMKSTIKEMDNQILKMWDPIMRIYRLGVLELSPRYAAHLTVGGATMTLLRLPGIFLKDPIGFMRQSWQMAADEKNLPIFMSKGVSEQDTRGNLVSDPLSAHTFLVGRVLGRLLGEATAARLGMAGDKVRAGLIAYKNVLEHISNSQRSLALITGEASVRPEDITAEDRQMAKLWNTTPEKWIGAKLANKVLADMQVVSPMERAIIMRFIMPFWGWTRHIIRYMGTYPLDHPLRAEFIQAVANQAVGAESNLPDYLFRLLFLGQPNAQGNVTVLDDRQWNPFRDVANYMTWGGIMSSLNPVLQAVTASAWGVSSATGGPDLFPQLTYDSFYGSSGAAPTGGNFFMDFAKQLSPQIDTLTAVMSKTSSLRQQAAQHPGMLGYLIGDSLGLPWIPYTLNTKQAQIKATLDDYDTASAAVNQAMVSNSMAPLAGYSGLLPFSGYEVTKSFIQQMINEANTFNQQNKLDIPATDIVSLPYASPYSPEVLQGSGS